MNILYRVTPVICRIYQYLNLLNIIYYIYIKRTISVKTFVMSTTMKKILENIYFLD